MSFLLYFTDVDTKYIKAVVHGYVLGIPLPFPLPEPLACKRGVNCPVKASESNVYETTLPVKRIYPRVSGCEFDVFNMH